MNKLTVIIPIHEYGELYLELMERALKSINCECDVIIVGPLDTLNKYGENLKVDNLSNIRYINNESAQNIQSQINIAVKSCETEYFSILEFDDIFVNEWCSKRCDDIKSDIDILMPLILNYDGDKNYGYTNEAVWATSFTNEIGVLEQASLEVYPNFMVSGAFIKRDVYNEIGGLKEDFQIAFWYEFLLNALSNGKRVCVEPKIGYYHTVFRDGSFTEMVQSNVTQEEIKKWFTMAIDSNK